MNSTLSEQMFSLLYSVILGVALGILYELLKILRVFSKNKKPVVIGLDIFFMLIFTFSTVIFSMGFSRGATRYFTVIGELVGFIAERMTFGKLIFKYFYIFINVARKSIKIVTGFIRKFAKKLLQDKTKVLYNKDDKKDSSNEASAEQ